MKVIVINKDGKEYSFKSVAAAKPHLKKDAVYHTETRNGEKVRVYDDRER